jgi:hypothetical protein
MLRLLMLFGMSLLWVVCGFSPLTTPYGSLFWVMAALAPAVGLVLEPKALLPNARRIYWLDYGSVNSILLVLTVIVTTYLLRGQQP